MKKFFLYVGIALMCLLNSEMFAQTTGDEDKEIFNRAKNRDQQAIDEAAKGWWTASMKSHEARIQWWRQAKFGMFIHWGIYSLPGGEWKEKKISGYAEHLMRKEKISLNEYLNLAHQFNPVLFNANEWILHAKNAGMKYFIITAKHHDGFAMYDSKVSDFDIMDQSSFKRDPMAELAAAAKKHGIKFGFYYSHAFDWEHPDAPGNDWEYNNPGGDKLLGGANWYDTHPEWLPKAVKYVNEKAIPQIKELLTKYRPDILWFDTPHKLPLSENIRILKAIRETDPNVVVNGRLVRNAAANFGDYRNTADRPAEFYPVTGDWEAIPTTNESYGYHQYDNSHKPVSHFIKLLASATSRGGNLLMNIGPKGDGSFDKKDLSILKGIGSWLKKNGESIYLAKKSSLPFQSWGVSTLKNNKLYLHVFNWPTDGKLYVGGLKSGFVKAYLLADPVKKLTVKYFPTKDFYLDVPLKSPDSINTVIVLELKNKLLTDSTYFIIPNTKKERLLAFDAMQTGKGFAFGDGKTNRYYVEGWTTTQQNLSWKLRTLIPGEYIIQIKYLAPEETSGGDYSLVVESSLSSTSNPFWIQNKVITDPGNTTVITQESGMINLESGLHTFRISPLVIAKKELMKLLEIQLLPVSKENIPASKIFSDAEQQTRLMLSEIPIAKAGRAELVSPRTIDSSGKLRMVSSRDWTSGFFPGQLWFLYEFTGKDEWKTLAREFTANLEKEKTNGTTHDMGFKIYCSFGAGYKLTKDPTYRDIIIQSAKTLTSRFRPITGTIRSWDHSREKWGFPVIIDNMMNLELLFAATQLSGDSAFYKIAVTHANTTMKNHFRDDNSSYHVVEYDTLSGNVVKKNTHQGYSHESAWARGQAWGLYGYTMCYRFTRDIKYLQQAEKIAAFLLNHPNMPKDLVPFWDFNAPNIPGEEKDASAAAIMASALYELSMYSDNGKLYKEKAERVLESLTKYYRSPLGENKGFILLHSTGSKPGRSEVDVPLNYADYYYLEAVLRMKKLKEGKMLF